MRMKVRILSWNIHKGIGGIDRKYELGRVVEELEACRRTYPDHHVRLIGYDNYTQSQGTAFVVYEGR